MSDFSAPRLSGGMRKVFGRLWLGTTLLIPVVVFAQTQADLAGVWRLKSPFQPAIKTREGQTPPLLPQAAAIYRANSSKYAAHDLSFDKSQTLCTSPGMPRLVMLPYPFEIVQRPDRLAFIFEWNKRFRLVDLSGKPLVVDDLSYRGTASGHWEGAVLVVQTRGLVDTSLLDTAGMPHSEDLQLTERYRLEDRGKTLVNEITVDDPKTFSRSWQTVVTYRRLAPGTELEEDVCRERISRGLPAFELDKWK